MSTTQWFLVGVIVLATGLYPLFLLSVVNNVRSLKNVEEATGLTNVSQQETFRVSLLRSMQKSHYVMTLLTLVVGISLLCLDVGIWILRFSAVPVVLAGWHTYRYISIEFMTQTEGGKNVHHC